MGENSWYKEGLSFKCTGCGQCCTGFPGYVWITPEEMQAMAEALAIPLEEFTKKYTRKLGDRYSLKERPEDLRLCLPPGQKMHRLHDPSQTVPHLPLVARKYRHQRAMGRDR